MTPNWQLNDEMIKEGFPWARRAMILNLLPVLGGPNWSWFLGHLAPRVIASPEGEAVTGLRLGQSPAA